MKLERKEKNKKIKEIIESTSRNQHRVCMRSVILVHVEKSRRRWIVVVIVDRWSAIFDSPMSNVTPSSFHRLHREFISPFFRQVLVLSPVGFVNFSDFRNLRERNNKP